MVPNIHGDLPVHYMENQGKVLADDSVTARSSSSTCGLWPQVEAPEVVDDGALYKFTLYLLTYLYH